MEGRGRRQHRPAALVAGRRRSTTTRGWSASCRPSSSRTWRRSGRGSRCSRTSSRTTSTATARSTAYASAKLRVFERQGPDDVAVVPRGFRPVPGDARRVEFAADDELPAEPLIRGVHNRENAAAATAAARAVGVPDDAIARGARDLPRRRAPDRGGGDRRRRPLRERLEGDERGRGGSRRLGVRRTPQARHPRRAAARRSRTTASRSPSSRATARTSSARRSTRSPWPSTRTASRTSCTGTLERSLAGGTSRRVPRRRRPPVALRAPRSTSSRASSTAGRSSAAWCRSSPGDPQPTRGPRPARAEAAHPRHPRARRVRARDGLQRDVRVRDPRRGRPDAVPRQAGPVRRRRARPPRVPVAGRLPRVPAHRAAPARRHVRRVRRRARPRAVDQRRPPLVPVRARQLPAGGAREARRLRLGLRRPGPAAAAAGPWAS